MHKLETCKSKSMIDKNRCISIRKKGRCETKKQVHQSYDYDDYDDGEYYNDDDYNSDISLKMKMCMKWTKQLHEKFLNALSQLGEESINLSLSIFIQVDLL
ncbi:putative transcription regulator Homeodomain-LIKE family [Helianthus annuus]|nr:putative transcription regulator Homeodomain-LIKE family [Helianthus annuus]